MRKAALFGVSAAVAAPLCVAAFSPFSVAASPQSGLSLMNGDKMIVEALKAPLKITSFSWAAGGMTVVPMEPVATHICLLTEVSGNFAGGGERVGIEVDNAAVGGPRWVIKGNSGQPALRASASCARKDQFTPGMWSPKNVRTGTLPIFIDKTCGPTPHNIFKGDDTAGFVRDLAGRFRGGGEALMIGTGAMGNTALHVAACSGYVGAGALMLSFGGLGPDGKKGFGGTIKYYGLNGRTTQIADATMSYQSGTGTPKSWSLFGGDIFVAASAPPTIPVDKALCGIVAIGGKFEGYGERVRITPVGGNWVPEVITGSSSSGGIVRGSFRCIARDQR